MTTISSANWADSVRQGVLLGVAGGIAEIVWIASYGAVVGSDTIEVARAISSAVGRAVPGASLAGAPVFYGVAVHMLAAAGLGIALSFLWHWAVAHTSRNLSEFGFMSAALAVVWAFNFFVVLPLISPAFVDLQRVFVDLVPYQASLASKLLFGVAAAVTLRYAGRQSAFASIHVRGR